MTHSSCDSGAASLERLEFLGDAVLDGLMLNTMCNQKVELSQSEMHHLRAAFVNGHFLAFMCMEWKQDTGNDVEERTNCFQTSRDSESLALWKFMRSQGLSEVLLAESSNRHRVLRDHINEALAKGSHSPWALLSRLQAPKFLSDIVESILGAVYIDAGSLDACEGVVERMGILPHLRRAIRDNVRTLHPQEELKLLADVGNKTVKYVRGIEKQVDGNLERDSFTCEVFVGEQSIVLVSDTSEKIEIKAAEAAVRILKEPCDKPNTFKTAFENSPVVSMI